MLELEEVPPQPDKKQKGTSKENAGKDGVFILGACFYAEGTSEWSQLWGG